MPTIEKPMNPYAEEDFANAIKEAVKDVVEEVKYNYNEFPKDKSMVIPHLIWDMPTEYSGIMRLQYSPIGAWQDVFNILVANGYTVTATVEDATETEREVDGADKFVVIEYGEVE